MSSNVLELRKVWSVAPFSAFIPSQRFVWSVSFALFSRIGVLCFVLVEVGLGFDVLRKLFFKIGVAIRSGFLSFDNELPSVLANIAVFVSGGCS